MIPFRKNFGAAALAVTLASAAGAVPAADIPVQAYDAQIADGLPADIREAGVIRNVVTGSFVPYTIANPDNSIEGATADFSKAVGEVLGVKVTHTVAQGFAGMLLGIAAGRYDVSIEPCGDFPEREQKNDFVDYVQEYVVFAVPKGNPKRVNDIADICGLRVSVMAGGSAERTMRRQSEACVREGRPAVRVMSFEGQAAPLLAVRSGRADAFFSSQAPLSHFVGKDAAHLELAAVGRSNGFGDLYQGAVVAKGSPLGPVLVKVFEKLHANGTYDMIMDKWGLENNKLARPGLNLATSK